MKNFLFLALIVVATPAFSQSNLQEINQKRIEINITGMKVLGGWALANMAIGSVAYFSLSGKKKYFNQMNLMWNVVNLGLATAGYFGAKADLNQQLSLAQSINDQHKIEQILLLNAGLDVGYMAAGLYLNERGLRKSSERFQGYGQSLILQGAFLLVFDGAMYAIHKNNGNGFSKFLDKANFSFDGRQVGLLVKF